METDPAGLDLEDLTTVVGLAEHPAALLAANHSARAAWVRVADWARKALERPAPDPLPVAPAGFVTCVVSERGDSMRSRVGRQITHLVRLDDDGSNTAGQPTVCGLHRFPRHTLPADLPSSSLGGGVHGPGIEQVRCPSCWWSIDPPEGAAELVERWKVALASARVGWITDDDGVLWPPHMSHQIDGYPPTVAYAAAGAHTYEGSCAVCRTDRTEAIDALLRFLAMEVLDGP